MEDLLLIMSMAAVFILGWFLMKKLDFALNRREEEALDSHGMNENRKYDCPPGDDRTE